MSTERVVIHQIHVPERELLLYGKVEWSIGSGYNCTVIPPNADIDGMLGVREIVGFPTMGISPMSSWVQTLITILRSSLSEYDIVLTKWE